MKKYFLHLSIMLISLITVKNVFAQSSSKSAVFSPTVSEIQKVEDLKSRLATKVAELTQIQKMAIYGSVKSTSLTQLTVETKTKEIIIELTDDIKVFQEIRGKRTKLGVEDVDKKDNIVVFGEYDATLDVLKAKIIFIQGTNPERVSGTIQDINNQDYTIEISDSLQNTYTVDFEKSTVALEYTAQDGVKKSGFSKFQKGSLVSVLGTAGVKDKFRLSALRILMVGNKISSSAAEISPAGK